MTRTVLDTNTWVSGLGWGGPPGEVVEAALAGRFEIVTSPALLDELRRVLAYPKLAAIFGDADQTVELITLASHVVRPALTRDLVRDPDDNRVLEAAIAGGADVIVTGDADLLDLRTVEGVRIVTPADFVHELNSKLTPATRADSRAVTRAARTMTSARQPRLCSVAATAIA